MIDSKEEMRDYASQLFALVITHRNDSVQQKTVLEELMKMTKSKVCHLQLLCKLYMFFL